VYWHIDDVDAVLERAVSMGATQLKHRRIAATDSLLQQPLIHSGNILGIMYNPHYLEIPANLKREER
jgi:hypothetical protein